MGNCLRKNQVSSAQDEGEEVERVEKINVKAPSSLPNKVVKARREDSMKKKVRFKVQDGRGGNSSTSGAMRIRLVVTKEELKRVLSNNKNENGADQHISLEQLLSDMRLREKSVSKIEGSDHGSLNSCWRPALESIAEDRSMK